MERSEAESLRDQMTAEHPDRATHSFILSERDGDWTVAKVALPPASDAADTPGVAGPAPVHSHDAGKLPGGVPPGAAGF
ncbi:MAG TPA: hypothetical protein VKA36_03030 [Solirubrobacterales bacterium]|nr:hypothetical protein [Solirubrobacterales bacterium]